jgi:gliding motility-associated-like protein
MPAGIPTGHSLQVTLTLQTDTLIQGEVCITPDCDYLNQTLRMILVGRDTFDCQGLNIVYDTVYLQVVEPYNQPPVIQHYLNGLNIGGNGQVMVIPQTEAFCYALQLEDPDSLSAQLIAQGVSWIFNPQFNFGNPAALTYSGTNPLTMEVCWKPSCYDSDSIFALVVCGRDTSRCAILPPVCDTVYFSVGPCTAQLQNVFTPNGDGINDVFMPFDLQGVEYYDFIIYDRWGSRVFEGHNQLWDGKINGKNAAEGVYYYRAEYQFFSAKGVPLKHTQVDWVTLLR